MRGGNLFRMFATAAAVLTLRAAPALAQQQVSEDHGTGWEGLINRMDTGTVAVVLIFGTALVAVLGGIIPGIVRACRGDVHHSDELVERIAHLEHRVASLEQRNSPR